MCTGQVWTFPLSSCSWVAPSGHGLLEKSWAQFGDLWALILLFKASYLRSLRGDPSKGEHDSPLPC